MNQAIAESEIDLVIRMSAKDTSAFEQLVVKHQNLVCAISLAILGDVTASEGRCSGCFLAGLAFDLFAQGTQQVSQLADGHHTQSCAQATRKQTPQMVPR